MEEELDISDKIFEVNFIDFSQINLKEYVSVDVELLDLLLFNKNVLEFEGIDMF